MTVNQLSSAIVGKDSQIKVFKGKHDLDICEANQKSNSLNEEIGQLKTIINQLNSAIIDKNSQINTSKLQYDLDISEANLKLNNLKEDSNRLNEEINKKETNIEQFKFKNVEVFEMMNKERTLKEK